MSHPKNAFYAQSGGVTAVINATAAGIIEAVRQNTQHIHKLYAGKNGILGALHEELIDTSTMSAQEVGALKYTPAGAFGSCRYKLKSYDDKPEDYHRLIEVFKAYDIGYFFYNGGNDSMDTACKIAEVSLKLGYPLICIGIPKTIDNDLPFTDHCPGFGSVAKYVATSISEAGLDVASMAASSTKVFVLEVMGRHAGWIAAATGLASQQEGYPPHLILFPEIPFIEEEFFEQVTQKIEQYGHCAIVVSEGVKTPEGRFLSDAGTLDAFGHSQLGGAGQIIAEKLKSKRGLKVHCAVADYLQRAARHIASQTDAEQAEALGRKAIEFALNGKRSVMLTIERLSETPYRWEVGHVPLVQVANQENKLPREFITKDGYHITPECRRYLSPLIQGEAFPPFENGLPQYHHFHFECVPQKLSPYT